MGQGQEQPGGDEAQRRPGFHAGLQFWEAPAAGVLTAKRGGVYSWCLQMSNILSSVVKDHLRGGVANAQSKGGRK